MQLSVVTTSFNGARFLPACLESVSRELSTNCGAECEHVVVDAASQDASLGILRSFASDGDQSNSDYYLRFISEPDCGQSEGFNKGVRLAKSEWILWLNSDDELAPGAIKEFLDALKENPKAEIIYGHVEFIDESSRLVKTVYTLPYYHWLIRRNVWSPPSSGTFFRRELFLREPLDPDYHFVMDIEWFLRAGYGLRGVLVDRVMCRFRVSTQGKTSAMITNGSVSGRHSQEREQYREKYIYCQWPLGGGEVVRARFKRRQKMALLVYYLLKLRYLRRYVRDRLLRKAYRESGLGSNERR